MGRLVNFHVSGSGQLNGRLRIDKTVEMDDDWANRLRGDKKALVKFVETQYPGASIVENSLSVRILPITREEVAYEKPEREKNKKKEIGDYVLKTEKLKSKTESKRIINEAERERLEHQIEVERLKGELEKIRLQKRKIKIGELNDFYNGVPKNFIYYLKLSWLYLDTGWKKALVIFILWTIIASIYNQITDATR